MIHSDDILPTCFYSISFTHLATYVEWSEGTVKLLYLFGFQALSSLVT